MLELIGEPAQGRPAVCSLCAVSSAVVRCVWLVRSACDTRRYLAQQPGDEGAPRWPHAPDPPDHPGSPPEDDYFKLYLAAADC